MRYTRDVGVAEEATADAFELALRSWPDKGVPDSVEAWLVTAARRRALDRIRRADTLRRKLTVLGATAATTDPGEPEMVADDELRLLVLCAHPALSQTMQVSLMLRLACGVPTAAIAAGFLVNTPTMAARLTRAKAQVRSSGTSSIDLPDDATLAERMPAVRRAVHLAYTLGHTAGSGADLRQADLAADAVHLARTLHRIRPEVETTGLLALLLLTEARTPGRFADDGEQVLLADVDRSTWNTAQIAAAQRLLRGETGVSSEGFLLQARIAAVHADAPSFAQTDWNALVDLYAALLTIDPSPTIAIGRAIALGYAVGPDRGLADLDEVAAVASQLVTYPYLHAARAAMLSRLGRPADAADAWQAAARHARTDAERDSFTTRPVGTAEQLAVPET